MPDDVRSCFVKIFKDKLDVSSAEAEECVQRLESEGRYQLECWWYCSVMWLCVMWPHSMGLRVMWPHSMGL